MLATLLDTPRMIVILRFQEDLDPSEISEVLDMPVATVKSHLHRSLALLRRKFVCRDGRRDAMKDFEEQLKEALARKPAPAGFAEKVAARAHQRRSWRTWVAGSMAASLLAGALVVKQIDVTRERERGQVARAQLLQAFEITRAKVKRIEGKMETLNP